MNHTHTKTLCKACGTVVSQCRCMNEKVVLYVDTCENCKSKPPKTNEELMTEFDIQQRMFLAGKLHSTKWNVWFKDLLTEKDKQREEAVAEARRELAKTLLHHLQECEYGQAFGVLDKVIASSPTK